MYRNIKLAHAAASFSFTLILMSSNVFCGTFCEFIFISVLNDVDEFRGLRQYILRVAIPNEAVEKLAEGLGLDALAIREEDFVPYPAKRLVGGLSRLVALCGSEVHSSLAVFSGDFLRRA